MTDRVVLGWCLIALATPPAAVALSRFVGVGPAPALAESEPEPLPEPPSIAFSLPQTLRPGVVPDGETTGTTSIVSPFWHEAGYVSTTPDPLSDPDDATGPATDTGPTFVLSAVMPHPRHPAAIINARPCSIGDTVVPGWRLISIDGDARLVVLSDRTGRQVIVRMSSGTP